jgi:SAM-dependent methyltransferase
MSEAGHYEQAELWGEDVVFTPEHQGPKLEAVHQLLPPAVGGVVDVGAGDGRVLHHLMESAPPPGWTIAADRSRAALRHARSPAVQASGDALPFADRSIPAVICCEVLEHLPREVFEHTLAELQRVTRDVIVVTVPNREHRQRAEVRCHECGCAYNPDRHLRSFEPEQLPALFPAFRLDAVVETGPRQPVYPRAARVGLERLGLLVRPGSPTCPQCGAPYRYASRTEAAADPARRSPDAGEATHRRGAYDLLRRLSPKARHPYWLGARFVRPT